MVLDRRMTQEIARALLRARNKMDGGNILESVTQSSAASGNGNYGESEFGEMGFPSALQPGVTTGDKAANQLRKYTLTSGPHPFPRSENAFLYWKSSRYGEGSPYSFA